MNDDDLHLSPEEMGQRLLQSLDNMEADARVACEKIIFWLADNPKEWDGLSSEKLDQMFDEVRLEVIRRRLGGKVGTILPFKKPGTEETD
ncbi:hypothetical protein [Flavobacterium sp.]|uniref:hypothetical protein n=1 Tax=Flavobacterium sp. TaxID=239 RepID=UPI002625E9E3|nr:hypothetical protein [Flavobacterium sp.]